MQDNNQVIDPNDSICGFQINRELETSLVDIRTFTFENEIYEVRVEATENRYMVAAFKNDQRVNHCHYRVDNPSRNNNRVKQACNKLYADQMDAAESDVRGKRWESYQQKLPHARRNFAFFFADNVYINHRNF